MFSKHLKKVNGAIELFNKSFKNDIAPYNEFRIKLFKKQKGETPYENMYLLHLYKGKKLVSTKWLDYGDIVGVGNQAVGRNFFWWVNDEVIRNKSVSE